MEPTELDYVKSAGIVIYIVVAITMAVLYLGRRWLRHRAAKRARDEIRKEYGKDWR